MAEEAQVNQTEETVSEEPQVEEKQSNKTFTQSEFDKMLKKETSDLRKQVKELKSVSTELEELRQFKEESENEKMSAVEKAHKIAEEYKARLEDANKQLELASLNNIKNEVLADPKYSTLPKIYKSAVKGDDENSIIESAEAIYEQWQNDMPQQAKKKNVGAGSIGAVEDSPEKVLSIGDKIKNLALKKIQNNTPYV